MGAETISPIPASDNMETESPSDDDSQFVPQEEAEPTELPVEEFIPEPDFSPAEEKVIFDRKWVDAKQQRHHENVTMFTGFWRGKYYFNGVGQTKKNKE